MVKISIYFDTSSSMSLPIENDSRRDIAEMVWQRVCHRFTDVPTKITTICSRRKSETLGALKTRTHHELANIHVPYPDGMTYLWKFLVDEAQQFVNEDSDWIFFLVSDGLDNQSRGKFRGASGIRPCIEAIEKMGIDAEFHIIGLGLPEDVEEIFEQLSGATGGFFQNITEEGQLQQSIEDMNEALEDITSESERTKKRLLRQRAYLKNRKEGQLDVTKVNQSAIQPPDDGYLYGKVRVYRTNPERTQDWQNDLLRIQGHNEIEQVDEGEFWYQFESRSEQSPSYDPKDNSWSIDTHTFSEPSTFAPTNQATGGLKRLFRRGAPVRTEKSKGQIDKIFELIRDIRASNVPPEKKKVILRGHDIDEVYIEMLKETGAQVIMYPRELPPPPPPDIEDPLWSDSNWLYLNPTLDWTQYPHAQKQMIHDYGVIDPFVPKEYFYEVFSNLNFDVEISNLQKLLKQSNLPFKALNFDEDWFADSLFDDEEQVWVDDWSEIHETIETMKQMLKIALIQILSQYSFSQGNQPTFIVLRLSEFAKKHSLYNHPAWNRFKSYCMLLNTWAEGNKMKPITFDFWT
ncbi:MAG: hypothetical protein VW230_03030 [Candidatus Poseidoniales archaeon]